MILLFPKSQVGQNSPKQRGYYRDITTHHTDHHRISQRTFTPTTGLEGGSSSDNVFHSKNHSKSLFLDCRDWGRGDCEHNSLLQWYDQGISIESEFPNLKSLTIRHTHSRAYPSWGSKCSKRSALAKHTFHSITFSLRSLSSPPDLSNFSFVRDSSHFSAGDIPKIPSNKYPQSPLGSAAAMAGP